MDFLLLNLYGSDGSGRHVVVADSTECGLYSEYQVCCDGVLPY